MSSPADAVDRAGLKARLRHGDATFGTFLGIASPVSAEICATGGVDWVLLDLEHGSGGEEQMLDVVPAAASYGVPTLVRAESTARIRAGRLLDLGAVGVMFPRIDGPADAAAAVRHLRYPPDGDRGVATYNRMCRFGLDRAALARAEAEVLGIVQIETRAAVESVEAIAALDGVDVLFVGPQDLSYALGVAGDRTAPVFVAALDRVLSAARAAGKAAGLHVPDGAAAARLADEGWQFLAVGSDGGLLATAVSTEMRAARRVTT
jgi:2-dehydro-3-deoxyglucarate aldolase/4-hydroxy-2-oxoheptanedioate aldolase